MIVLSILARYYIGIGAAWVTLIACLALVVLFSDAVSGRLLPWSLELSGWARGNIVLSFAVIVGGGTIIAFAALSGAYIYGVRTATKPTVPGDNKGTDFRPHIPTHALKQPHAGVGIGTDVTATVTRAIRKSDTFTTMVPINTAAPMSPVPLDENLGDPRRDFYGDLVRISIVPGNAAAANWPVKDGRKIATHEERFNFVTRLMQFYVLQEIQSLHRGIVGGMKLTIGEGATPINRKPIPPPNSTEYPPQKLLEMLQGNEFLTPSAKMMFEDLPFTVPVGTIISLLQIEADPKEGKLFTCIIRFENPSHYRLDLSIQPSIASGVGTSPAKFKTGAAATVQSYTVTVKMNAEITRTKTADFDPDEYAAWATALFAGLEKQMGFD
jgi:hypothetical protein